MRRREFIAGLGGATAVRALLPLTARAQQRTMPVIGFLSPTSADASIEFLEGLKETGYVEGRNVAIEHRGAEVLPLL
jgi:putative tryptophan/tyrosine transport system substrate-binding protein